jgi:hypothetical protein
VYILKFRDFITHHVSNNSFNNAMQGVLGRIFYITTDGDRPPRPLPRIFNRLRVFTLAVCEYIPNRIPPLSLDQFLDRYKGRRRGIYQRAVDRLLSGEIGAASKGVADVKFFMKADKIAKDPDDAVPRVISPRCPEFNALLGCHISHLEHRLYHIIDQVFYDLHPDNTKTPVVAKGHNAAATGSIIAEKWRSFNEPAAVGLDMERFDQCVSEDALEFTHSLYRKVCVLSKLLNLLLDMRKRNKFRGYFIDGFIEFIVKGIRCSGDMDTAMGNIIIMCAINYVRHRSLNVHIEGINNGDDWVTIIAKMHLAMYMHGLRQFFLDFGFRAKIEEPVYVLEEIEFCQTHPVYDGLSWTMVRNFPQALFKDCVSIKPLDSPGIFATWCKAIGECGLALAGGMPVYNAFYQALTERGVGGKDSWQDITLETGFMQLARGMHRKYSAPTVEARVSFWKAFKVTPDVQLEWESKMALWVPEYSVPTSKTTHLTDCPPLGTDQFRVLLNFQDVS